MKAYVVFCSDEDDHGQKVTFAESSRKADREANSEICDCPFIERRVKRAKQFDKYSPGPVTTEQCLAEGWFYPCGECEKRLSADDSPLVTDEGRVYCDRNCILKSLASDRKLGPNAHKSILDAVASMERLLAAMESRP